MADCFSLYGTNLVDTSTNTASTTNAQFPLTNLTDFRRSKVFRSTSNTSNIVFNFGSPQPIDAIFILADKRNGFGGQTMTVEFNSADSWGSPAYSIAVPLSESLKMGNVTFPDISYQYARVVITSSLGYGELSKIFIGKKIALSATINFGWSYKNEDTSVKSKNRYGQIFTDTIARQKALSFAFKNITKDDLNLINLMLDDRGENKPFYITIGNDLMAVDYRRFSGGVFLDDIPTVTNSSFNRFNLSMVTKEMM
jgi:hypothetical protein